MSQPSYGYRDFITRDSINFRVIEYSIDSDEKYLDANGGYKEGVEYENFNYPTDSVIYEIKVRKDGAVYGEQTMLEMKCK